MTMLVSLVITTPLTNGVEQVEPCKAEWIKVECSSAELTEREWSNASSVSKRVILFPSDIKRVILEHYVGPILLYQSIRLLFVHLSKRANEQTNVVATFFVVVIAVGFFAVITFLSFLIFNLAAFVITVIFVIIIVINIVVFIFILSLLFHFASFNLFGAINQQS